MEGVKKALLAVGSLYGFSTIIMALYFNWVYAQENGFLSWLLFGEIIATLKGIFWPFFIFG